MDDEQRVENYAQTLSKMIQAETVSVQGEVGGEKFRSFHTLLRELFPSVFSVCDVETFRDSLLLHWHGQGKGEPILLMSHHDVVAAEGTWTHPPFSGEIADGRLWGRGILDTKGTLWAMLTAAEELISAGYTPARDIWFESACTEETDGSGADEISEVLQKRGIRFYFVLDEGGAIMYDPIGGADGTFAVIGVGEKGCTDIRFTARSGGGHASMPGRNTPLVRLGKFMAATDSAHIFKAELAPVTAEFFSRVGTKMTGVAGFLMRHAGAFKNLLCYVLPKLSDTAGAMLKTTIAFTTAGGSHGLNILPEAAFVTGNMRFSHWQGEEDSIAVVTALAKKYDIETEIINPGFPSPISDFRGEPFRLAERAVDAVFPGVIPVPYVMTGASDSRFFSRVSDHCLRFAPILIDDAQLGSIHGADENIYLSALPRAVDFYRYIITEA